VEWPIQYFYCELRETELGIESLQVKNQLKAATLNGIFILFILLPFVQLP
jgi:hypothetical protein